MVAVQAWPADERLPPRTDIADPGVPRSVALTSGAIAATAGLAIPLVSLALESVWPVLALPPLVAVAAWEAARYHGALQKAVAHVAAVVRSTTIHDELTGCANEAGLRLLTSHLLPDVRRRGDALHAFAVDVDQLGRVNEMLGYGAGDEVLLAVADAVRACTRGSDVVSRGQDDEFVVVGPGTGMRPAELERRVRVRLVESTPVPTSVWPCRVTAGHALLRPWDNGDVDELVHRAREDLLLRIAIRAPCAPEPPLDVP